MTNANSLSRLFLSLYFLAHTSFGAADDQAQDATGSGNDAPARIALIIDDLGHWKSVGLRAASLPGPVACAILPHTPFGRIIAEQAYEQGKEVMLHLPLAPIEHDAVAAGTIYVDTTRSQLQRIFALDLESIPHVVGVNNHMGSMLTQHPGHMTWLMNEISKHEELFFIDSLTSEASVAMKIAHEMGIPTTSRDIFLDNVQTEEAITAAFDRLKTEARRKGVAIGIGHPFPVTLDVLERVLPGLEAEGLELISVTDAIRYRVDQSGAENTVH